MLVSILMGGIAGTIITKRHGKGSGILNHGAHRGKRCRELYVEFGWQPHFLLHFLK
jgi:hypothetical protein